MAFWDDAKKKMLQAMKPRQQQAEGQGFSSNRADGGFSGYVPKMKKHDDEMGQTGFRQGGAAGYQHMMPDGVDPSTMHQFQPVGGQTGAVPPQQGMPQQGMPPQHQQVPPRPQAQFQGQQPMGNVFQQPEAQGFGRHGFNQPVQQPQQGFTARQNPVPPQNDPQTFAFSGGDSYVVDGHAYKMVLRVAQITGVPAASV